MTSVQTHHTKPDRARRRVGHESHASVRRVSAFSCGSGVAMSPPNAVRAPDLVDNPSRELPERAIFRRCRVMREFAEVRGRRTRGFHEMRGEHALRRLRDQLLPSCRHCTPSLATSRRDRGGRSRQPAASPHPRQPPRSTAVATSTPTAPIRPRHRCSRPRPQRPPRRMGDPAMEAPRCTDDLSRNANAGRTRIANRSSRREGRCRHRQYTQGLQRRQHSEPARAMLRSARS